MTLVELMIAIGITVTLSLGIATFVSQQQRTVRDMQVNLRTKEIAQRIERALSDPNVIRASSVFSNADGNVALRNCLSLAGDPNALACSATDPRAQVGFELILPFRDSSSVAPQLLEKHTIAGSPSQPALYNILDGRLCSRAAPERGCDVKVRAYFWATCGPQDTFLGTPGETRSGRPEFTPTLCSTAQTLHLRYQVVYEPAIPRSGSQRIHVSNYPPDKVFWVEKDSVMSTLGAITIPVSIVPRDITASESSCAPNFSVTGIQDGEPVCECLFPYTFVPSGLGDDKGACFAEEKRCAADERFRGVDADGGVICTQVCCETKTIDWNAGGSLGCKRGGWMESIRPIIEQIVPPPNRDLPGYARDDVSDPSIPDSSCRADLSSPCAINKYGGSCTTDVTCKEEIKCCYEFDETPADLAATCTL